MDAETTKLVEWQAYEIKRLHEREAELNGQLQRMIDRCERQAAKIERLREALEKLRDCDWTISLPDRMDAVRDIASQALEGSRADG